MLREVRVPMLPATAATATARAQHRRPFLKVAATFFHWAADAVIYASQAAMGSHSLATALQILGRWVFGSGSSAEAVGAAVRSGCFFVVLRLLPITAPLVFMRMYESAEYYRKQWKMEEEGREKLARNHTIMAAPSNEQLPKRNIELPQLPKGFSLTPLYASAPLGKLMCLAITMKHCEDERSLMWRVGSVLDDVACLGLAVSTFFMVRNLVLIVTVPRVKEWDNVVQ